MVATTRDSSSEGPGGPDDPGGGHTGLQPADVVRILTAIAMAGAGIIHFAYAPVHLDVRLSHGLFFLVTGWLQLMLAAALVLRTRPQRAWLGLTAVVNLGIVAVWVVSRTVGVPGSAVEKVGFPDVTASVLEAIAVLGAFALLADLFVERAVATGGGSGASTSQRFGFPGVGVGALATVVLVSMAVSPSFAGEHSHGAGGHSHATGSAAAGHTHGAGAVDPAVWAKQRYNALAGYASPDEIEQFKKVEGDYLANQLRRRSRVLKALPADEREKRIDAYVDWAVENTISLLEGAQKNGTGEGMHSHGPVAWQPITDPAQQRKLQGQLEQAAKVIERYPTVADAEAGGYYQISPYVPGIGAHWISGDFDDKFDPGKPEMLLYNGTNPTSQIVGLSYATISSKPPEGFVGPNDLWHTHPGLCMVGGLVVGIDGTPKDLCESVGGDIASSLANLHMMHLWQVPGWESSWGLFSAENDKVNVATSDIGQAIEKADRK
jgi:hypothetical protein